MPIRIFNLSDPEAYEILKDPKKGTPGYIPPLGHPPVRHDDGAIEQRLTADERRWRRAHLDLFSQGRDWEERGTERR